MIGEAKIDWWAGESLDESTVRIGCEGTEDANAPDLGHGDVAGKSNDRSPSYTAWADFCERSGLKDVFYEEDFQRSQVRGKKAYEMRGGHPGAVPLTQYHLQRVRDAKRKWLKAHPGAKCPSSTPCSLTAEEKKAGKLCTCEVDWTLGRLDWLEFWMEWALKNCKKPIVFNS